MPSYEYEPSSVPSAEPSQYSEIARTMTDNILFDIFNDDNIAEIKLKSQLEQWRGGALVCGSQGEITSDKSKDDFFDYWNWRLDSSGNFGHQKKTVWTRRALEGDDQLCQRISFALSQIFAISPSFLSYSSLSEFHLEYYGAREELFCIVNVNFSSDLCSPIRLRQFHPELPRNLQNRLEERSVQYHDGPPAIARRLKIP